MGVLLHAFNGVVKCNIVSAFVHHTRTGFVGLILRPIGLSSD